MIRMAVLLLAVLPRATMAPLQAQTPGSNRAEHDRSWATVSGRARDVRFQPLTRADGIAADPFYQALQDRRGFLWLTTQNGLIRYDGYQHVRYPGLPLVRKMATRPDPGLLYEDRQGNLGVGPDVLSRFDPDIGVFTRVLKPRARTEENEREAITAIHDGPNGTLWVAVWNLRAEGGSLKESSEPIIYQVDPARGTSVPYRISADIVQNRPVSIRSIEEDAHGRLWLGASIGLIRFDPGPRTFQHYPHTHPNAAIEGVQRSFNSVTFDKTGHLWVHMPAGIERFDLETGAFDRLVEAQFYEMTPGPDGRLWLWGGRPGLLVFDPSSPAETALRTVFFNSALGQPMQTARINGLGADRHGNLWASPEVGSPVQRYSPLHAKFGSYLPDPSDPSSLSGGDITGMAEDPDGSMWIGSGYAGLNRLDPRTRTFTRFRHVPGKQSSVPDEISRIYIDRSGTLWIGGQDGTLGRFDRKTGGYTHLTTLKYKITLIFEDTTGRFWVGAMLSPMNLVDRKTGEVKTMGFRSGYLTYEDREGNLWFAYPPPASVNSTGRAMYVSL